jgi:hypothetical protein
LIAFSLSFSETEIKEKQFIAGYILIQSKIELTDSIRAVKFDELKKITGVSTDDAIKFISKYRNNPEEWQNIVNATQSIIQPPDSLSEKNQETKRRL